MMDNILVYRVHDAAEQMACMYSLSQYLNDHNDVCDNRHHHHTAGEVDCAG